MFFVNKYYIFCTLLLLYFCINRQASWHTIDVSVCHFCFTIFSKVISVWTRRPQQAVVQLSTWLPVRVGRGSSGLYSLQEPTPGRSGWGGGRPGTTHCRSRRQVCRSRHCRLLWPVDTLVVIKKTPLPAARNMRIPRLYFPSNFCGREIFHFCPSTSLSLI